MDPTTAPNSPHTTPEDQEYWAWVEKRAAELKSDGCTGVKDWRVECCKLHDILWRDGVDREGRPVSASQANKIFRECIQSRSRVGKWSPLSWIRWAGVTASWWGWYRWQK